MKAILKNYRQSPRKVRLVGAAIKGKSVSEALLRLKFMPKRSTETLSKLILSAAANAKQNFDVQDELVVKNIEINKGVVLKRYRPRARGSAYRINKRTSNIVVTLAPKVSKKKSATVPAPEKASVKKVVAKKKTVKKVAKKVTAKADK